MEAISVGDGETVTTQTELIEANGTIGVSVVQVPIPNHPVQVQSVIQQPSVIQTASGQTIQVGVGSDGDGPTEDDSEARKRREILARRPSYRKIFNDLSSDPTATLAVSKIEEESNSSDENPEAGDAGSDLANSAGAVTLIQDSSGTVVPAQAIQLASHDGSTPAGLQTLTMTNVSSANASSTGGATIVQYAQGPEGQFFIPVTLATSGSVQYQIATTPSTLPQSVVMATTGSAITSPQQVGEEASRKRELRLLKNRYSSTGTELRLLKNREAARECRRKKKEYVKCLENRVAVLENQNKALIEELKSLKELYCQKEG